MLVLSRKKGESIVIQDQIELTILSVEGDTVKVGISAPKHVDIFRKEVYLSIQESNRESVAPQQSDLKALIHQLRKVNNND
ncbi:MULTISPECIES: carbon storage regulator CsrA [Paenibacillus]|uniref:Translational regulator CsrA n=1 Tax=Paenibacillus odorifer TaxID=189426 RepID=A0ABX3HVU7_9BACL|nr:MULTISPECIES: carbon storage regulator CsrA [Paenibacillus]OMD55669.1 carbon storage regulator [Paenibacillus odorifer]OZQ85980.1 carbon storage regulator [Paenibacillus sp. VTT E-133291]